MRDTWRYLRDPYLPPFLSLGKLTAASRTPDSPESQKECSSWQPLPYKNCTFNSKTRRFIARHGYRSRRIARHTSFPRPKRVSIERKFIFSIFIMLNFILAVLTHEHCRTYILPSQNEVHSNSVSVCEGMKDDGSNSIIIILHLHVDICILILLEFQDSQLRSSMNGDII